MAAKGGRIDFMFLAPPYPAAGSATDDVHIWFGNWLKINGIIKQNNFVVRLLIKSL